MDFEAEEVVRLREEILRFVLQQLKESAQTGELRKASEELTGPIGAAVEAAVQRAIGRGGGAASGSANARIGDLEINRIARAVASQLGGKAKALPVSESLPQDGGSPDSDDSTDDYYNSGGSGFARRGKMRVSLEQVMALVLALLVGIAIGVGISQLLGQGDQSLVGSEATQVITETQPVATSDTELEQVEGPQRPAASGKPEQGSQSPQQ